MRREHVEGLAEVLANIDGPCVVAVDAAWGMGKSTFLRMLAASMRKDGFTVSEYNAWDTDFTGDPFAALSAEMLSGLSTEAGGGKGSMSAAIAAVRRGAIRVIRAAIPAGIRLATYGVLNVEPLTESVIADAAADFAESSMQRYTEVKQSVAEFRRSLEDLATKVRDATEGKPLVIVIDELDRCRPTYAIETLEVAKHLFGVDGVVFVLGLDRAALSHSVCAVYGAGFDAPGYLRRFIDVDYLLPNPERRAYLDSLLLASGVGAYFDRTGDAKGKRLWEQLNGKLLGLLAIEDIGLREISQCVHRLAIVFAGIPSERLSYAVSACALAVLRTLKPAVYLDVIRGRLDSKAAYCRIRDANIGGEHSRDTSDLLGVIVALGVAEGGKEDGDAWFVELGGIADGQVSSNEFTPVRANDLIAIARNVVSATNIDGLGFQYSIDRLELIADA